MREAGRVHFQSAPSASPARRPDFLPAVNIAPSSVSDLHCTEQIPRHAQHIGGKKP
jgi:hypothetical protein